MKCEVGIAQAAGGARSRGGRGPNEINRRSHGEPEVRVKVVTNVGIQYVDGAIGVSGSTKLQICSHAAFLRGG